MRGTSTDGGSPGADSWSSGSGIIQDGETLNLGLHPVGTDYGVNNNVLKFTDNSATAGEWGYFSPSNTTLTANAAESLNYSFFTENTTLSASAADADLTLTAPNIGNGQGGSQVSEAFSEAILTSLANLSDEGNCAGGGSNYISQITEGQVNTPVYKNFGINTDNDFYNHSTHFDYTQAILRWKTNEYQLAQDIETGRVFSMGQIVNTLYPDDTANNKYFSFLVTAGFYHKIQMRNDVVGLHKTLYDGDSNFLNLILNCATQPDSTTTGYGPNLSMARGPVLTQGNGNGTFFTRGKYFRLQMELKFVNYDGDANYGIASHSITDSTNKHYCLYSDWDQITGDTYPMHYDIGQSIDVQTTKEQSASITTLAEGASISFGTTQENLNLEYYCYYDGFLMEHMYMNDDDYKIIHTNAGDAGEQIWGIWYHDWFPGGHTQINNGSSLGWGNLGDATGDYRPRYRIGFAPRPSMLKMCEVPDSAIKYYPWYDIVNDPNNMEKLYTRTTRVSWLDDWYFYDTSDSADSWDGSDHLVRYSGNTGRDTVAVGSGSLGLAMAAEGSWYGHGIGQVLRPSCWTGNGIRVYQGGLGNGSGPVIAHKPVTYYLRNENGSFINNYAIDKGYYDMPTPLYDSSTTKYRSMGIFKLENTGDYPVYIQQISVATHNFSYDGTNAGNKYQPNIDSVVLPERTNPASGTGTNPLFTPTSSSATPTWKFALMNENGDNIGSGSNIYHTLSINAFNENQSSYGPSLFGIGGSTPSTNYSNSPHLKPLWDGGTPYISDAVNSLSAPSGAAMLGVVFDLTATGNSVNDQGEYWVQVLITYYVDEYQNRYKAQVNGDGNQEHEALTLSGNDNTQSRLQFSKYLVRCKIEAPADIVIVDSENDEIEDGSTITFPVMSVD